MDKIRVIGLYLPQYHPTPSNDKWWGKGFTEWTNVGKAKPLFKGHYQPKVPADLGYYDLRIPEVRLEQAEMARSIGVEGFCYYHYWFGNGRMELEMPFEEVLQSGKPDFPFCLCWANESWHSKFWTTPDGITQKKLLVEQQYLGEEDDIRHFQYVLKAFQDPRYIKVDGKPLFMIYKSEPAAYLERFIKLWQQLSRENGFPGIYFIAYSNLDIDDRTKIINTGFDGICCCRIRNFPDKSISKRLEKRYCFTFGKPITFNYKKIYKWLVGKEEFEYENVFPTLVPNWDHTPRSGKGGFLFTNSTPENFEKQVELAFESLKNKPEGKKLCFIKSWNEWGEGNYVEPDLKYGWGYLNAIKRAVDKFNNARYSNVCSSENREASKIK